MHRKRQNGSPALTRSILHTLDRLRGWEMPDPDQLAVRARALLEERYGIGDQPIRVAFAQGYVGLMCDHTHFFNGFALLLPIPFGTMVAARRATGPMSRVVVEGSEPWSFDVNVPTDMPTSWPSAFGTIIEETVRVFSGGSQVELAVLVNVPESCPEGLFASVGVACARALTKFTDPSAASPGVAEAVTDIITRSLDWPFSIAYALAASADITRNFVLVDAQTRELLPMEAPPRDKLGWGLIQVGSGPAREEKFYRSRKKKADQVVADLRMRGFEQLTSLRDLDHADLQRALTVAPRSRKGVLRYLVTENRRVQKMIAAVRKEDWQVFGAMLMMSHASKRTDWESTNSRLDYIVEQAETMSIEGIHGACMAGRGESVIVTGQPFAIPTYFDRVEQAFKQKFGDTPEALLI